MIWWLTYFAMEQQRNVHTAQKAASKSYFLCIAQPFITGCKWQRLAPFFLQQFYSNPRPLVNFQAVGQGDEAQCVTVHSWMADR